MKKFIIKNSLFLFICIPIAVIYYLPNIYIIPYCTGDIGRMGKIPFGSYDTIFHPAEFNYVENIDNFDSLQKAKIITIGDSFSQQNNEGYQNYLGHSINHVVHNFRIKDAKPENTAYTLIKKGMIPNCKILIVESVERAFIKSLLKDFRIIDEILDKKIMTTKTLKNDSTTPKNISFSNNLILSLNNLSSFYKTKLSVFKNYKVLKLREDMFTSPNYSKSIYFNNCVDAGDSDLLFRYLSEQDMQLAHNNLDVLVNESHNNGITIIYMIAADKYDMYYDYIEDNPYPRNPTFDYFADFDSTLFINTKTLLLPYINKGIKDVYRVNDTHWSPIAAKIVGEHLASIINNTLDNKQ